MKNIYELICLYKCTLFGIWLKRTISWIYIALIKEYSSSATVFTNKMSLKVVMKMNTLKIKAMYPLSNHQKHISLSKVLKERHANSRRFVRFKSPQRPEPGYKTDHLLETGILRKKTEGDNIERETLLKMEL